MIGRFSRLPGIWVPAFAGMTAEKVIPVDPQPFFDAVILDPPRAGAAEQVAQLAESEVPRIAYVSCNPATFARDAKMLVEGGYTLGKITPVGQFRWSTHVELAAGFSR